MSQNEIISKLQALHYWTFIWYNHGSLAWYVNFRFAHEPGMPGTFFLPPRVSDPNMHHETCVTHVPWCFPGSLTSGFLIIRSRGKRSQHSRYMRNPQFYVFGKRPIAVSSQKAQNREWTVSNFHRKWWHFSLAWGEARSHMTHTHTWISNHIHYQV